MRSLFSELLAIAIIIAAIVLIVQMIFAPQLAVIVFGTIGIACFVSKLHRWLSQPT